MPNQNPEQKARDRIDTQLASGWAVQDKDAIDFNEGEGQTVREYTTESGPADFVLFVNRKPVGTVEDQAREYSDSNLNWAQYAGQPLSFLYEATSIITRFFGQLVPQDPTDEPASTLLERIRKKRAGSDALKGRKSAVK